jgi:hypothetical protein
MAVRAIGAGRRAGDAERIGELAAGLPPESGRRRELLARAHKLSTACGCELSGAFSSLAVVGLLVLVLLGTSVTPAFLVAGALVVFGAGFVGKAAGIGIARARLRHLRLRLERELSV